MGNGAIDIQLSPAVRSAEDDAHLVCAAQQDLRAAGRLYDKYYGRIFRYLFHSILDRTLTEDLTAVVDSWVNGNFHRTCCFKYTLADGRVFNMGEGDPHEQKRTPEQIARDHKEIDRLRKQGKRELVRIIETDVGGSIHRVCIYAYQLSDGRTQTVGKGDPDKKANNPNLNPEQSEEVWRLRGLKRGEFLGNLEREIHGLRFVCETYLFTLEDGTVVTHAVGSREGRKEHLTEADWQEFRSLGPEAGKLLDVTEKEVHGRRFRFERRLYILSDGTEFIHANGTPVEE